MQQQMTQQASTVIAPEPGRKIARAYFISLGCILGGPPAIGIGSLFLPEPFRDELFWNQLHSYNLPLSSFIPFLNIVLPLICIAPFINIPFLTSYKQWKWRILEKRRQRAVENRLRGWETETSPLPEVSTALPATLSVRVRRNWRATWIGSAIYALPIGYILFLFTFDWQINVHYLAQRGEISGWTLLGGIIHNLFYCVFIFPALSEFLLAPRQCLIATRDGLMCYRGLRFDCIPWHEARLFAVIAQQKETLVYELSSKTSVIRWSSRPTSNYADTFPAATMGTAPLGLVQAEHSTEEHQWHIRQLTAMVAARTGLPLSDLREQTASRDQQSLP